MRRRAFLALAGVAIASTVTPNPLRLRSRAAWPLGAEPIAPTDAITMMETDGAVFIDVRTSGEALTYGAPTASLNVPAFTWDGQLMCSVPNFVENVEEQVGGPDDAPPLVVGCKTGRVSGMAAEMLEKAGYGRIYDLEGGCDAWVDEELPWDDPEYESFRGSVPGG